MACRGPVPPCRPGGGGTALGQRDPVGLSGRGKGYRHLLPAVPGPEGTAYQAAGEAVHPAARPVLHAGHDPLSENWKRGETEMDVSGEVADLMVKESIQITEESVKLLAAGAKNLTAFLLALAQDNKKLSGKTNMARLLREGKELKVFSIRESDLADFKAFAKKNVLYSVVKDKGAGNGMVNLITNVDYVSQVNHFMESRGYAAPARAQEEKPEKKDEPRARPDSSSPQRGSGSTPSQNRTRTAPRTIPVLKWRPRAIRPAPAPSPPPAPTPTCPMPTPP